MQNHLPAVHFVHLRASPGGIEVLLPEIIKSIPERPFQVFVIRPTENGNPDVYEGKDIPVLYGSNSNLPAFWKLWRYARQYPKDTFHVYNIGPLNLLALRLAGIKKLIYSVHGTIYWRQAWKKPLLQLFWKLALDGRYRLIANSRYSRSRFRMATGYGKDITVVYNPFSSQVFKPRENNPGAELKAIYCGRLAPGKNLFRWMELAAEIQRRYPQARFYLYGEGPLLEELKRFAEGLGLSEAVYFMGHTTNIAEAYQSASLLIFLSEYESFGNVAVESILCGTPVLVSDIPSMREIFGNYPEFIVPLNGGLTATALSRIARLPELKAAALSAREEFKARFGMKQHIEALKTIYAQLH